MRRRAAVLLPVLALATLVPGGAYAQSTASGSPSASASEAPPAAPAAVVDPSPAPAASSTASTVRSGDASALSVRPVPPPEDLDARATPIIDLHGYLRTRLELMQNFSLGWENANNDLANTTTGTYYGTHSGNPWYRNPDYAVQYCGSQPSTGPLTQHPGVCGGGTQYSANMRLRLEPEIHPTEFISLFSQIDLLDNLVLGSTPDGYYTATNAHAVNPTFTAFSTTQIPPIFGYNSFTNNIAVKRAWAEVTNQTLGQLRFGRMPSQWGLGILYNAGNGYDSDYQSTGDRLMYAMRLRPSGFFFSAIWDFTSSGATTANATNQNPGEGQTHDAATLDNVNSFIGAIGRRLDPEQSRAAFSRNELVMNGGLYFLYRNQGYSGELNATGTGNNANQIQACTAFNSAGTNGTCGAAFAYRNAQAFIPDLWLQLLGHDFRIELEAVYINGSLRNVTGPLSGDSYTINQFGGALEAEYRTLNNRLSIEFRTGYASGDPNVSGLTYQNGLAARNNGNTNLSLFQFHPDYRIDLILWRQILTQVSGAYYFRPSIAYNFIDEPGGDLLFGRVDAIWSRASEWIETRGHHADLGVEIDATLQYQTNHRRNDGVDRRPAPGFYANLQGGVLFPMGALGPTDGERLGPTLMNFGFSTAFTVRALMGVLF